MASKDLHNRVGASRALQTTTVTNANTVMTGDIIDTAGLESLEFVVISGSMSDADATAAVSVEHGDQANLSDAAAVSASDLLGSVPSFVATDDNVVKRFGYRGGKRYVRIKITPAANDAGSMTMSAIALQGHARNAPVA
jgi:predicted membrane GTPase involved in stress response